MNYCIRGKFPSEFEMVPLNSRPLSILSSLQNINWLFPNTSVWNVKIVQTAKSDDVDLIEEEVQFHLFRVSRHISIGVSYSWKVQ